MKTSPTSTIARCVLLLFACLAALSTAGAVEKPDLPEVVQFEHGGALYRVDYSDFYEKRLAFALEGGCYKVSIARPAGDPGTYHAPFDHGEAQAVRIIESPRSIRYAVWNEVFSRTTCLDDLGVTVRDMSGEDHFEFNIPRDALIAGLGDFPDGVMATVAVNGHVEELHPAVLYQLATAVAVGEIPAGVEDSPEFTRLAWHYSSDGWYHRALPVFQQMQEAVGDRYRTPDMGGPVPMSCWGPCFTCGISAVGTIVGGTALAASCATTFGATCIGGAVGVVRLATSTVVSCDECRSCRGGGGGGGESDCARGYHECCTDQCCDDDDPPADCGDE